mmetsp:Transcript_1766/g.3901  ORF Transcript_1766/g.3901 Transcript_1766/m.3901 type:complete len:144 (-) Transcript_1766:401-832(-)
MDFLDFGFIGSKENETYPLSIHEVAEFFENRKELTNDFESLKLRINEEKVLAQSKIYEYTKRFRNIDKIQAKKIPKIIDDLIYTEIKATSEKLQAKIILCKIIDLFPNTQEEIISFFPNFKKFFSVKVFRTFYKKISLLQKTS